MRKLKLRKKGAFFSSDALLALLIILFVILAIGATYESRDIIDSEVHVDSLQVLSTLKTNELNLGVLGSISGHITNDEQSVLESVAELQALGEDALAQAVIASVFDSLDITENIGVWVDGDLIYSRNDSSIEDAKDVKVARKSITGVFGENTTGYSARAFLSSDARSEYFYLGGYIGDGNLSLIVDVVGGVNFVEMELAINDDFELFVNNVSQGIFLASPSQFEPGEYSIPVDDFVNGTNLLEFRGDSLFIAGGFVKVNYNSEVKSESGKKTYLPGVRGIVNVYDSLYFPENVSSMEISLHMKNNITPLFVNLGAVTLYEDVTNGEETVVLNDTFLRTQFGGNYDSLEEKTLPLRIGFENVTIFGITQLIDIFSVTDLSGSMACSVTGGSCHTSSWACENWCHGVWQEPINEAKEANNNLIDFMLNTTGNRVGLAGYETEARDSDFHELSNNVVSLKDVVDDEWGASGSTCICCGIEKAASNFFDVGIEESSRVSSSNDDAEEIVSNGNVDLGSSDLELVTDGSAVQVVGMRFNNLDIPQGSGIVSAYIQFEGDEADSWTTHLTFSAQNIDNAPSFSSNNYDISSRSKTSASVTWSNVPQWVVNGDYQTPDLSSVVQEVIDRPGWVSGNSLAIIVEGSGTRVAESYDGESSNAPLLVVNFAPIGCGNGALDSGEECDDGNNINADGCSAICKSEDRFRSIIVMSDGQANYGCSGTSDENLAELEAIDAACDAYNNYGIVTHAIGFGASVDKDTLEDIASCGGGDYFYSSVGNLTNVFLQIAENIITEYAAQTINASGNFDTILYPDSYVLLNYSKKETPFGFIVSAEKKFDNSTSGSFNIDPESTILSANLVSYSGPRWTQLVFLNGARVYNLSEYGLDYIFLGDPYRVSLPINGVVNGINSVSMTTGNGLNDANVGSESNKLIYTIVRNISSFSGISPKIEGCNWTIQLSNDENLTVVVPQDYTGGDQCEYTMDYHSEPGGEDGYKDAVYNLLKDLDFDPDDGRVDVYFNKQDLKIELGTERGIPFPWELEVQVRRWY